MTGAQMSGDEEQRGWHSRGYVPHFDGGSYLRNEARNCMPNESALLNQYMDK
jgi:hypothetical protein